eukprot:NODE_156_length_16689_cov_0.273960.p15 type:complete len:103 gc:universal NODE_156_length_16689_cov_0.273960:14047-14355(+)
MILYPFTKALSISTELYVPHPSRKSHIKRPSSRLGRIPSIRFLFVMYSTLYIPTLGHLPSFSINSLKYFRDGVFSLKLFGIPIGNSFFIAAGYRELTYASIK